MSGRTKLDLFASRRAFNHGVCVRHAEAEASLARALCHLFHVEFHSHFRLIFGDHAAVAPSHQHGLSRSRMARLVTTLTAPPRKGRVKGRVGGKMYLRILQLAGGFRFWCGAKRVCGCPSPASKYASVSKNVWCRG